VAAHAQASDVVEENDADGTGGIHRLAQERADHDISAQTPILSMDPALLQAELFAQLEAPFTGEALFDCLTDLVFFIKNARVAKAIRHVQSHFDEPLRVTGLAALAGLSPYQFDQRIRRVLQITAGQFIHRVRMDAAVRRLRETNDPIALIALDCGHSDQGAFTRQFHQTVGLSPTEFRRARTWAKAGW